MDNSVELRFFASARAAAGVDQAYFASATLTSILALACIDKPLLNQVVVQCSFLLDGVVVHDQSIFVNNGSVVDVLPRFAGG